MPPCPPRTGTHSLLNPCLAHPHQGLQGLAKVGRHQKPPIPKPMKADLDEEVPRKVQKIRLLRPGEGRPQLVGQRSWGPPGPGPQREFAPSSLGMDVTVPVSSHVRGWYCLSPCAVITSRTQLPQRLAVGKALKF